MTSNRYIYSRSYLVFFANFNILNMANLYRYLFLFTAVIQVFSLCANPEPYKWFSPYRRQVRIALDENLEISSNRKRSFRI